MFTNACHYLQAFDKEQISKNSGNFIQRFILSEIKAAIAIMLQETKTERYVSQVINAEEKFPLTFNPKNPALPIHTNNRKNWGFLWKESEDTDIDKPNAQDIFCITDKNISHTRNFKKVSIKNPDNIFFIKTSQYQLQFLDQAIPNESTKSLWKRSVISMSSPALIAEQSTNIKWNSQKMEAETTTSNLKNFINLHINIKPDITRQPELQRYLGLDVGEYGIAYCVIEPHQEQIKIITKGFLFSNALRNIKTHVPPKKNKLQQLTGTFSITSSKVDRVRENAIHELRYQIHDIVTRYHAKPVYEYSISNFETGSGKINIHLRKRN